MHHRTIGAKSTDPEVTRKVTLNYSQAAASAFSQLSRPSDNPFHFVFVSGVLAVRDQKKSVWLYPAPRKLAVRSLSNFDLSIITDVSFLGYS